MENNHCPLCAPCDPQILIWENQHIRIILANEPAYPGFVRVIWKQHVAEMTQLSSAERELLMDKVYLVEELVRGVLQPQKVNLAALGNMVPHIHWHVVPRFADDATFPGSVWSEKVRETPPSVLEQRRVQESLLKKALQEKLNKITS